MKFDLEKALAAPLSIFVVDEARLFREAFSEFLAKVAPDGDDFDVEHFDADSSTMAEWWASAGTAPFLSDRRTVIVRHLLRNDAADELKTMPPLPSTARIVLVADEEPGDDDAQRRHAGRRTKWQNAVGKLPGALVWKFAIDAKQVPDLLRDAAKDRGYKLSPTAALLLTERVGGSLSLGTDEMEKCILYLGDDKTISEGVILKVTSANPEWNVFRMVEAAISQDARTALTQLKILLGGTKNPDGMVFSSILPMSSRYLKLLWQAKATLEGYKGEGVYLEKPNFGAEPPYRQKRLTDVAKRLTFDHLNRAMQAIADADCELKGLRPSTSNAIDTVERLFLTLAQH